MSQDAQPRCEKCKKLLALSVTRPWRIACGRCKHLNEKNAELRTHTAAASPENGHS